MIKNHVVEIRKVNVNQQSNTFNYIRWSDSLSNKVPSLDFFKYLNETKITRKVVTEQFSLYFSNPQKEDIIKPFLLCMIWGYEGSGYGPARTLRYFNDADLVIKLKKAFNDIAAGNIEAAFNELVKIHYLSTSFASKVLYFAAKSINIDNYPLIFDMRAATGLINIACSNQLSQLVSIMPKKGWESYKGFCDQIHKWAEEYDVEADMIETYLFNIQNTRM